MRLSEDGIMVQWLDFLSEKYLNILTKTLRSTFSYVSLWWNNNGQVLVVASKKPLEINMNQLKARINLPSVKEALQEIGIDNPFSFLKLFITANTALNEADPERHLLNTDNTPVFEYQIPMMEKQQYILTKKRLRLIDESILPYIEGITKAEEDMLLQDEKV